jgi:hypothetical protein
MNKHEEGNLNKGCSTVGHRVRQLGGFTTNIDVEKDSQGRLYVQSAHEFLSNGVGDPDDPARRLGQRSRCCAQHSWMYPALCNPISGQPLTTIEVRKPAPLNRENGVDDGDEN